MSYDPYEIPEDSICFKCKNRENKNSMLTGIGVYCNSYRSDRAGMCISGGNGKECRGFESR